MHRSDILIAMRQPTAAASLEAMLTPGFDSTLDKVGWSASVIAERRDEWVRAIGRRRVGSTVWPEFRFADALADRLLVRVPDHPEARRHTATTRRSVVNTDLRAAGLPEPVRREIFDWWDAAYMDVLAEQHGTTWLTTLSPAAAFTPTSAIPATTHPIPEVIVSKLATMSGPEFATLRAEAAGVLPRMRARNRGLDRFRFDLLVLRAGAVPHPVWEAVQLALRLVSFGLLIVTTFASGGVVRLPLVVAIAVASLVVLTQVPWPDLAVIARLRSPLSLAILRTPGRRQ